MVHRRIRPLLWSFTSQRARCQVKMTRPSEPQAQNRIFIPEGVRAKRDPIQRALTTHSCLADMDHNKKDRLEGALIGLLAGDALGTALENVHPVQHPISDMVGGGPFNLNPGEFTDDGTMALLLAESLVLSSGFDAADQMRRYLSWYQNGHLSSTFNLFDIGIQTRMSVLKFDENPSNPFPTSSEEKRAGNGSLMRLAPIAIAFGDKSRRDLFQTALDSSRTTHGAKLCLDACVIYAAMMVAAIDGASKEEILAAEFVQNFYSPDVVLDISPEIKEAIEGSYKVKEPPEIEGSGYVVKSLEAALWAFFKTDNYRDGCLAAANLGADADTTAAIYGMLAGAFYGASAIPKSWRDQLAFLPYVEALCSELIDLAQRGALKTVASGEQSPFALQDLSEEFQQAYACFNFLEVAYRPIRDRLIPGPSQYLDLATFDADIATLQRNYNELTPNWAKKSALMDDVARRILDKGLRTLQARLAKPKIALPFAKKG